MKEVKVIIWGLGAMGGGMADMLLKKKGVEIVGVAGRGAKIGTSMYDYIKTERGDRPDVKIQAAEDIIKQVNSTSTAVESETEITSEE